MADSGGLDHAGKAIGDRFIPALAYSTARSFFPQAGDVAWAHSPRLVASI